MANQAEVIVVGAGPVGFLTALGLARAGIEARVLEAEAGINDSPRASMYFPTTVKILDRLELLAEALEIGLATTDFCRAMLAGDAACSSRCARRPLPSQAAHVRARSGETPGRRGHDAADGRRPG